MTPPTLPTHATIVLGAVTVDVLVVATATPMPPAAIAAIT
jgi:hypothetical protein